MRQLPVARADITPQSVSPPRNGRVGCDLLVVGAQVAFPRDLTRPESAPFAAVLQPDRDARKTIANDGSPRPRIPDAECRRPGVSGAVNISADTQIRRRESSTDGHQSGA